jgi:hypothetical protein
LLKVCHKDEAIKSTRVIKMGAAPSFALSIVIPKPAFIGEESVCYWQRNSRFLARRSRASE